RMLVVHPPRGNLATAHRRHECFELVVLRRRNERARVFSHLLDSAEVEHPVLDDRAADRSAELLPAEWRFLTVGLLLEVVLPGELLVAFVPEDRTVHQVRAGLRDERHRRAAGASIG